MSFGNNPIKTTIKSDGNFLDIVKIFSTFQGEGIFTGFPAVFVRLGGCNLACKFCDTEFDLYKRLNLDKIFLQINKLSKNYQEQKKLVVITGGEPFRQNIKPLCKLLIKNGFEVQIETNGTLFQDLPKKVKIICSPKNNTGKYYPIRPDLLPKISAFKFLISASNKNYNFVPEVGQKQYQTPVYLQPIDEYDQKKNQDNHKLTIKLAKKLGYRLSLQTHKIWQID